MKQKLNLKNTLFFTITPIVSIIGTIILIKKNMIANQTLVLAFILYLLTHLATTAGYHRLFSHRSYKTRWPIRLFFIIFGSMAIQSSAIHWSSDHRNHHLYTDTDRDPYNIKKGFWHAHIGWIFTLDTKKRDLSNVKDLFADPLLRFQHKFDGLLSILCGFIFPLLVASLWGDPLGGLFIAGGLRLTLASHLTFCINSVCHYFGTRPNPYQSARDHWLTAIFTLGEGYHNQHHRYPLDYRNGIRLYDFDPTKWFIWLLEKLGLAWDLKRVEENIRLKYK